MIKSRIGALFLVTLMACSSSAPFIPTVTQRYFTLENSAEIIASDSIVYIGTKIHADKDSVIWKSAAGERQSLPVSKVKAIRVRDYVFGYQEGALAGAIGGSILGFIYAQNHGKDWGPGFPILLTASVGGGVYVGALIGGVTTGLIGHIDEYVLNDSLETGGTVKPKKK